MQPLQFKILLDILALVLGAYSIMLVRRSSVGGKLGSAIYPLLGGIFVLSANHAIDTFFLDFYLKSSGHVEDFFQPSIIHRLNNLLAFALMAVGFYRISEMGKG
ncbi:MAG: hypothetical protein HZB68_00525 [Candidatus Aenigmarchaeota archaeon]|nr:hypothetical protein [Candidatus Aenigmarchaeota archaeon]